ncbi:hypothetical protein ACFL4Q_02605 [candidate division KSB1 bacterium]
MMETSDPMFFILILNCIIVIEIIAIAHWANRKKRLRRKGLSEEYIALMRKDEKKAAIKPLVVLYGLQAIFIALFAISGTAISQEIYMKYVFPPSFILSLPYSMYLTKKYNVKFKDLAIKTESEIIIDFKYKALGWILNRKLELISLALIIYFNIMYLNNDTILYLSAALPWLIYYMMRNMKYQVLEMINYRYRILARSMILLQLIKSHRYIRVIFDQIESFTSVQYLLFILLAAVLAATVIYGLVNYPKINRLFPRPSHGSTS